MKRPKNWMRWALFLFAGIFYFYEYFLRVAPSVIVPELMKDFSVDAAAIGGLSAFYFYIYAPMQLPAGMLADRFGGRRLLSTAAMLAGLGSVLFAISPQYLVAGLGRLLMGFGSSFGFVSLVYICSHWFEERKRGLLIGLGSSIGTLGAVFGEGPMRELVDALGWRTANLWLGIAGILFGVLILLTVRNTPKEMELYDEKVKEPQESFLESLKVVARNPHSWWIGLISLFLYAATPGLAGLWGIPYLTTVYGYSTELSGYAVSMTFVGWAIGGPLFGRASDWLGHKKPLLLIGSFLGIILTSLLFYLPHLSLPILFLLFLLIGVISGSQILTYAYSIDVNPLFAKGTAAAFTNFLVISGASVVQPLIGSLLDLNWTGKMADGIRTYSASDYSFAMSAFPLAFLIAFLMTLFLKPVAKNVE